MTNQAQYHRIIVGIDGSKQADRAVQKAIAAARRNEATLYLVNVLNLGKLIGLGTAELGFGSVNQEALDDVKFRMERLVAKYRNQALEAGVTQVEMHVTYGNPKLELGKHLPKLFDADLIVLGATGVNMVERMVLGSTASYAVANAPCDVLIVRR